MRAALSTLAVARPSKLAEALKLLSHAEAENRWRPLAGGTDLFVYLNDGSLKDTRFLDVSNLRELRGIRVRANGVRIGAAATFTEIRRHATIARRLPSLSLAAAEVGALQIQNRATIGGNIANASPAGDSLPVLMAHDAEVCVRSVNGARAIAFERLYRGYRDLEALPDELITEIAVPFPPARAYSFFRKVGTRRAQSISKVVFAGVIRFDRSGAVDHVRLAYGSVAPVTLRAYEAEQTLLGRRPASKATEDALAALAHDISPIDDIRSDREYRMTIAGNVLAQFLRAADAGFSRG